MVKMKIAYLDCFAGISGDMFIGALIDLGLEPGFLKKELKKIPLAGYSIKVFRCKRGGISGTRFVVSAKEEHKERTLKDILALIKKSRLKKEVKDKSSALFNMLGKAEAKAHGVSVSRVHFHEVGAVDSIIDIIGAVIGVYKMGFNRIYAGNVRLGANLPPATLELLEGVPVEIVNRDVEMVTPTGAVFLKGLVSGFSGMPKMKLDKTGYGAGSRDDRDISNVLKVISGELIRKDDGIFVIETNIDDMNPQRYGALMETLFKNGALDVFWTAVQMKKNRPGILVTVLSSADKLDDLMEIIFKETTTFGVRYYETYRRILDRRFEKVGGKRIKIGSYDGKVCTISPEYEEWKGIFLPRRHQGTKSTKSAKADSL